MIPHIVLKFDCPFSGGFFFLRTFIINRVAVKVTSSCTANIVISAEAVIRAYSSRDMRSFLASRFSAA